MAKQIGDRKITGTRGNITYYKMDGEYYARLKSSLTRKQFRRRKCFEGSRRSADRFAEGNKIAGLVYRSLPERKRVYALFCLLKTKAIAFLKEGRETAEVMALLQAFVQPVRRNKRLQQKKDMVKNVPAYFFERVTMRPATCITYPAIPPVVYSKGRGHPAVSTMVTT